MSDIFLLYIYQTFFFMSESNQRKILPRKIWTKRPSIEEEEEEGDAMEGRKCLIYSCCIFIRPFCFMSESNQRNTLPRIIRTKSPSIEEEENAGDEMEGRKCLIYSCCIFIRPFCFMSESGLGNILVEDTPRKNKQRKRKDRDEEEEEEESGKSDQDIPVKHVTKRSRRSSENDREGDYLLSSLSTGQLEDSDV